MITMSEESLVDYAKDKLNWEADKEYFLSFVGMAVLNPDYEEYVGGSGRLEIDELGHDGDEAYAYTDLEVRYLTKNREELIEFKEQWDLKEITGEELLEVIESIENNFRDGFNEEK